MREVIPYASRRDVGAGLSMAAFSLLAVACWIGLLIASVGFVGALNPFVIFSLFVGTGATPVAVPTAFVVGTLTWRQGAPPEPDPRRGMQMGAETALGSLVVFVFAAAVYESLFGGGVYAASNGAGVLGHLSQIFSLFMAGLLVGLVTAGWFVVPLGVVAGWYHERSVAFDPVPTERPTRPDE